MNNPFKLTSNDGAELKWDNYSFSCNNVLYKKHKEELRFSDNTESECWGDDSDFSYAGLKDVIMYNVGLMFKYYPETKEQFFQYAINYPKKNQYD